MEYNSFKKAILLDSVSKAKKEESGRESFVMQSCLLQVFEGAPAAEKYIDGCD